MLDTPADSTGRTAGAFARLMRAQFAAFESDPARKRAAWLEPMRRKAFARFSELGLPTTHDEAWRCTSVAAIETTPFGDGQPAPGPASASGAASPLSDPAAHLDALLDRASFGVASPIRLVFVGGRFAAELSSAKGMPAGVRLISLADAMANDRALIEPHLGRHASFDAHAFTALNTAFLQDGALLSLPADLSVEAPIFIFYLSSAGGAPSVSHPRSLILAGARSRATIIESYAGTDTGAYFTNAVTEIIAADGAVIDHYKLQREGEQAFHIAGLQASLGAGTVFTSNSISLGGALVRNDIGAVLDGEGAECTLNGLFIGRDRQHVDNHTIIDHAKPHGTSRETYKGILDGQSRGVFDGSIVVRQDAQKTDARQANRNLLLSDGALIDTKPQLEIRADDVKCAHAATIGRLDETSLFYLRSRGLGLEAARALLIHAFAADILGRITTVPLRTAVDAAVSRLLLGEVWDEEAA